MNTTSASLLERLRLPEEQAAWTRFVQLYTPLLLYWAGRLHLRDQDAADLVQDVFVLLVRKLPDFRYDKRMSFRAWLRTVLHNVWRNRCSARATTPLTTNRDELPDQVDPDQPADLDEVEYRQHLVTQALKLMREEFHPTTWQACWELVVNSRSAAEVASELGITPNAAYLAKSRVLARLRKELDGLLD